MVNTKSTKVFSSIVDSAKKRFCRYGLKKTTMTEIAGDIGLSKASLYYYFPNKEELFKEVVSQGHKTLLNEFEGLLSSGVPAEDLLHGYLEKRLIYFRDFAHLSSLSLESINSLKPVYAELFENFRKEEILLVGKILAKGIATRDFQNLDIDYFSELFIAIFQGLRHNVIIKKDIINLTGAEYSFLQKQYESALNMFVKGIKK
jgi:AcrR family transcriptional regulator